MIAFKLPAKLIINTDRTVAIKDNELFVSFNNPQLIVTALVVKVDANDQKISLSIRAVTDKAERAALKEQAQQQSASQTTTLGDLLAEKLQAQNAEVSDE